MPINSSSKLVRLRLSKPIMISSGTSKLPKIERYKVSTTLMRFHLKTHRFRYVFTSRPHCNDRKRRPSFSETETFENASESGDIWKRNRYVLMWLHENGAFQKRYCQMMHCCRPELPKKKLHCWSVTIPSTISWTGPGTTAHALLSSSPTCSGAPAPARERWPTAVILLEGGCREQLSYSLLCFNKTSWRWF